MVKSFAVRYIDICYMYMHVLQSAVSGRTRFWTNPAESLYISENKDIAVFLSAQAQTAERWPRYASLSQDESYRVLCAHAFFAEVSAIQQTCLSYSRCLVSDNVNTSADSLYFERDHKDTHLCVCCADTITSWDVQTHHISTGARREPPRRAMVLTLPSNHTPLLKRVSICNAHIQSFPALLLRRLERNRENLRGTKEYEPWVSQCL